MAKKYRAEIAWPRDLEQEDQHFNSGINDKGEVRGLLMSGRHIGVTASNMRPGMLRELSICRFGMTRLFVDSGAFSEVDRKDVFKVVKPITSESWRERFKLYRWTAATFRNRAFLVAPDRVANQEVTLDRLATYGFDMSYCAAFGANIIVVVHKGALPMSEFWKRATSYLPGVHSSQLIAGIPMMKDATPLPELRAFCETLPWFGARVHLLGIGPWAKGGRFWKAIEAIRSVRPNAEITSDSALVPRIANRGGKKAKASGKDQRRILTRLQDEARAAGIKGSDVKSYGLTKQGHLEIDAQLARAAAQGWRDVELDPEDDDGELAEDDLRAAGRSHLHLVQCL